MLCKGGGGGGQEHVNSSFLLTSVRAQLQLIAVHRKMFISNIIKNKMPSVIHNQRSHDGRMPASSQSADITKIYTFFFLDILFAWCWHDKHQSPKRHLHGASAGSRTNTVVAAGFEPSSVPFPVGFLPFTEDADKTSPGHS